LLAVLLIMPIWKQSTLVSHTSVFDRQEIFLDSSQVFDVSHTMICFQLIQFATGFKFIAEPASFNFLLLATLSDFAVWITTTASTGVVAAEFHHTAQNAINSLLFSI
jgi:hypothetical protein